MSLTKLHVDGTVIKNAQGEKVQLSGFNGHPLHPLSPPHTMKESDIQWVAGHGFNVIRAIIWWRNYEPTEGTIDESYFNNYLNPFLSWCEQYNVYVVLDMHCGGVPFKKYGFPLWATDTYTDDNVFYKDFWFKQGQAGATRTKYVDTFAYLANRYKDRDIVAGYGLFNEPWTGMANSTERAIIAPEVMSFYNTELGPAIRAVDPDTTLFYDAMLNGARPYSPDLNTMQHLLNVVWEKSSYEYGTDYDGTTSWGTPAAPLPVVKADLEATIQRDYQKYVIDFGCPVFLSELGINPDTNTVMWTDDYLSFWQDAVADEYSLNYVWFRYGFESQWWDIRNSDGSARPELVPLKNHILSPIGGGEELSFVNETTNAVAVYKRPLPVDEFIGNVLPGGSIDVDVDEATEKLVIKTPA